MHESTFRLEKRTKFHEENEFLQEPKSVKLNSSVHSQTRSVSNGCVLAVPFYVASSQHALKKIFS